MDNRLSIIERAHKALRLDFNVIYRVNAITGEYEIIRMHMDSPAFAYGYKDFYELEEDYFVNGIAEEYVGNFPGEETYNLNYPDKIRLGIARAYFEKFNEPLQAYYREKSGRWLKLIVAPDTDYSIDNPYLIYAVRECVDEIVEKTKSIVYNTSVSRMYSLVVALELESQMYYCVHSDEGMGISDGPGNLSDFVSIMGKQILEEDYELFEELINNPSPDATEFIEREFRIQDENGIIHFLHGFTTYITVPEGKRILLLVRNIDERAASRARLKTLNDKYERAKNTLYALGSSYFGIYYVNLETKKITTSRRGEDVRAIFDENFELDEIFDRYISTIVYPEDRKALAEFSNIANIQNTLTVKGQRMFIEYQRTFGSVYRWVRLEFQAVKCVDGKAVRIIMAFKDIHEEKETELKNKRELNEALISAKLASEAKSRFLSNMSHDIRTPMNAIMGMTSIALAHSDDLEKVQDCLNHIDVSANHLIKLINEILDMSYIESGKFVLKYEAFRLSDMLDTVMLIMQERFESKNVTFNLNLTNIVNEDLFGDRLRIQQIIINILENAAKYTKSGGIVDMEVSQTESFTESAVYVITVRDTGKGMSEEFVKRIFTPFEREDSTEQIEGTGLGMPIVKRIVELMNGNIEVNSKVDKGTEFIVSIPIKFNIKKEKHVGDAEVCDYEILRGKKILIVDDNDINCNIACDYLEDIGVITDVAINGKEAYNMISSGEYFDAILMDVRMPIMNGYEATKRIREIGSKYSSEIVIVAMTANAFEEDIQKSRQAGMNDHISKPISAETLYNVLSELLS